MIGTYKLKLATAEPSSERMVITPEQAIEWLETANSKNRKVVESHVQRLARDMAEGRWRLNHSGIAFATDGTLLDGQHRLWAIVMSGVPVEMFVARNIPVDSRMTIDANRARTMADILNLSGQNGEVGNHQLAALRAMLGGFGNAPILSAAETSEALRRHHDAIVFALANLPTVASARSINTATTRAVIARAYYSVDHAMLKDFCRKLTSGIVTCDDERVIVLLRQHLQDNRGGSYSLRMQRYGKVERTLVAWLKGENPSRLYPSSSEQFLLPGEAKA